MSVPWSPYVFQGRRVWMAGLRVASGHDVRLRCVSLALLVVIVRCLLKLEVLVIKRNYLVKKM